GNPAKFIREIKAPPLDKREELLSHILEEYRAIADYHMISPNIEVSFPTIRVNNCEFNVEALTVDGTEDEVTDDFRDYVRKWGLRFYTNRPFRSVWSW
ncbi:hypothetical protein ACFLQV_04995, partial [Calditrichota bacterium]